jgi:hypothetical protein
MDGSLRRVTLGYAGGNVGREFGEGGDALMQTLAGDSRELKLHHVKSGGVFGRVMHLEAGGQRPGLSGRQVLVEDSIGVGVEAVLYGHDFLSLLVVRGQTLHKPAVVGSRAPSRNLDQALAHTWLGGRQQAGRALAHVGAAFASRPSSLGRLLVLGGLGRHRGRGSTGWACSTQGRSSKQTMGKSGW